MPDAIQRIVTPLICVDNLRNEKTQCQIDEILRADHAVGFTPDTLDEAHGCKYDNCAHCIGGSTR